jgi:hypothetical protein
MCGFPEAGKTIASTYVFNLESVKLANSFSVANIELDYAVYQLTYKLLASSCFFADFMIISRNFYK